MECKCIFQFLRRIVGMRCRKLSKICVFYSSFYCLLDHIHLYWSVVCPWAGHCVTVVVFTGSFWFWWRSGNARTVWTKGALFVIIIMNLSVHNLTRPHDLRLLNFKARCHCLDTKTDVSSDPQGDRGFDGLAGLPGEKGHRVRLSAVLWTVPIWRVKFVCTSVDVQRCSMFPFVAIGWAWTFWTPWYFWRGWREGSYDFTWSHNCTAFVFPRECFFAAWEGR